MPVDKEAGRPTPAEWYARLPDPSLNFQAATGSWPTMDLAQIVRVRMKPMRTKRLLNVALTMKDRPFLT